MQRKTIRYLNLTATGLLILVPSLYYLYGVNDIATISWAPAIVFWMFLVAHRLHSNLEDLLMKKRIDYTPTTTLGVDESATQKMRKRRGF